MAGRMIIRPYSGCGDWLVLLLWGFGVVGEAGFSARGGLGPPEADLARQRRTWQQHFVVSARPVGVRNYFSLLFRVLSTPEAHLRAGTDSPGGPAGNPIEVVGSN